MQEQKHKIEDSAYAPSFNCYSSHSTTSTAITKVIHEEEVARFHHETDDFEFSLSDEEASAKATDSRGSSVFPVFNRHILINGDVDREIKVPDDEIDASSAITGSFAKLFIGEGEDSSSYSSSEADELESTPPKCKKSRSAGSGSKRWMLFRYLLRRSNSEGKDPTVLLTSKKSDSSKHKRNSGEISDSGGLRWKAKTPVHEQFYVRRREEEKRKTYLPYRKDLVGLFANVNGMGKMLPF